MLFSAEIIARNPSIQKLIDQGDSYVEWKDGREARALDYIFSHPDIEAMRGQPSRALAALDEFSRTEDFLISVGPQKAGILRDLIEMEQPRVLVELGGYLGYSAILFADQLRRCSNNPSSTAREDQTPRVWSIEADPVFAGFIMSLADLAGLNDIIRVVPGTAEESLRSLQRAGELSHVDFLFLDHSEDLYSADLKVCEEIGILGPGSLIVADNVVRPGAPDYRNFVRNHPKLDSRGIPCLIVPGDIEDELEVSRWRS